MKIIEINGVKGVFGHAYTGHAQRKQRKAMRAFILKMAVPKPILSNFLVK